MRNILFLLLLTACSSPHFQENIPIKENKVIVIDPGHGGEDQGTETVSKPLFKEKNLTLMTARLVETALKRLGYLVVMTRETDRFVSLSERANLANQQNPLLFVSIHFNSAPAKQAHGIEVYYYHKDHKRSRDSKHLAEAVLHEVIAATDARSRGVKHGNFAVIRETDMPAILIEGGFMTNVEELKKLKDPRYLKKLANGIAQGIHSSFKSIN